MKLRALNLTISCAACLAVCAPALVAQTSQQLFGTVDERFSESTASYATPDAFNMSTLNLTCSASPITATLSGPLMNSSGSAPALDQNGNLQAGGNLLVDNNIIVAVTPNGGPAGSPANVCTGGTNEGAGAPPLYYQDCFQWQGYGFFAVSNSLIGQDLDTYVPPGYTETIDAMGGVAPISIAGSLVSGAQSVNISLEDTGGYVTNSTLFLTTNCTPGGVTGPALVNGNPIGLNPTPQQLNQSFTFNPVTTQEIGFVYNLSLAQSQNTLVSNSGESTPQVADLPVNPATFQANFAPYTSFATSECLIHTGELGGPVGQPATLPACKLYTLECQDGTNPTTSGALCPISSAPNEVVQDIFDGPSFTLQDIHARYGRTYHEGIGFLMASEGWGSENVASLSQWNWNGGTGGPCTFDPAADLDLTCPQNLLTSFTGPGGFTGTGTTTHPNSTFISVAQVPEDNTFIWVPWEWPGNWVNSDKVYVFFDSNPPYLQGTNLPGAASFIPAPIQSITYGVSPASNVPIPANEPIPGDITLPNGTCPIPTAANPGPTFEPDFFPPPQILTFSADGYYVLHEYTQDCAGTQDLNFQQVAGSWTTNFRTQEINVDTVAPAVTPSPLMITGKETNGHYTVGEHITLSFGCTDATSGVIFCGDSFFPPGTLNTGTLTAPLFTGFPGKYSATVWALDAAGNFSEESVYYTVSK